MCPGPRLVLTSPHLPIIPWLGIWYFPVTVIVYQFLPTISHGWLHKCFWNAAWFMHNDCRKCYSKFSSFLYQEIQRKSHLSLKRKFYHHTKYIIWHVVAISVICTAIGNANIFLVVKSFQRELCQSKSLVSLATKFKNKYSVHHIVSVMIPTVEARKIGVNCFKEIYATCFVGQLEEESFTW